MRTVRIVRIAAAAAAVVVAVSSVAEPGELEERNQRVVRDAFDAVQAADWQAIDRLIAADYVRHCQATPDVVVANRDQFKEFVRRDHEVVPDQRIEVVHLVAQGDLVAFWAVYRGTQQGQMGPIPPTGKAIELDVAGVHRIADGQIAETWITWDNLTALRQLGELPPPPEAPPQ
jgi:steroid delta-isomerase-like uncharacterized protein